MKKNFPLHHPRKADARVLDAIKHEVRKYVLRERRKPLPDEAQVRTFTCRVGADEASAETCALPGVSAALDRFAATGADTVFIAIRAQSGARPGRG